MDGPWGCLLHCLVELCKHLCFSKYLSCFLQGLNSAISYNCKVLRCKVLLLGSTFSNNFKLKTEVANQEWVISDISNLVLEACSDGAFTAIHIISSDATKISISTVSYYPPKIFFRLNYLHWSKHSSCVSMFSLLFSSLSLFCCIFLKNPVTQLQNCRWD